jgi:frataxin
MFRSLLRLSVRFSQLSESEFLRLAAARLEELSVEVEKYEENDLDVNSTETTLRIKRKQHAIVVNTQTPNRQLWYSSTLSGPQRYNYVAPLWINAQQK